MNLFSYIVMHDNGFSPNPFYRYCTLACCKPRIRLAARVGDIIVGLTPKQCGNELVYAMKVGWKLSFAEYWTDKRFHKKKPSLRSAQASMGDNIYQPVGCGFRQLPSAHGPESRKRDLSGRFVLASSDFVYFGSQPMRLPVGLQVLIAGRGHRRFADGDPVVAEFIKFFETLSRGRLARPKHPLPTDNCQKNKTVGRTCY